MEDDLDFIFNQREFGVGKRIKALRKKMKWTQKELAENVGVTSQVISNWEREYTDPDPDDFTRLAKIFNVTTDYLILGIDESNIKDIRLLDQNVTVLVDHLQEFLKKNNSTIIEQILKGELRIDDLFNGNSKIKLIYKDKRLKEVDKKRVLDMLNLLFQ